MNRGTRIIWLEKEIMRLVKSKKQGSRVAGFSESTDSLGIDLTFKMA